MNRLLPLLALAGLTPSGNPASRVDMTDTGNRFWAKFTFDPVAAGFDTNPGPHTVTVTFPGGRIFDAITTYAYTP